MKLTRLTLPPSPIRLVENENAGKTLEASGEQLLPQFTLVAYTGVKVQSKEFPCPVVVDLQGIDIPAQKIPVRFEHKSFQGVGHTERIVIVAKEVLADGLPVFLIFSAFMLHVMLRWRQLNSLKEAETKFQLKEPGTKVLRSPRMKADEPSILAAVFENERNFLHRVLRKIHFVRNYLLSARGVRRKFRICMGVSVFCLFLYIILGTREHMFMFAQVPASRSVLAWFWGATVWFYFLQISYQLIFFWIMDRGIKISGDRNIVVGTFFGRDDLAAYTHSGHRMILKDAIILLLAVPMAAMLLCVALGFARQTVREPQSFGTAVDLVDVPESPPTTTDRYFTASLPSDQIIQIVQIEIVLVFLTVLWGARNERRRLLAFAVLFIVTGIMTALFVEWVPLVLGYGLSPFGDNLFWWVPQQDKESFRFNPSGQIDYYYWHVFAAAWLVYSFLAALTCLAFQTVRPLENISTVR